MCLALPPLAPLTLSPPSGFHTFDYARHFLSCCSRMLGLEHETSRGSITMEYYGRTVGIKIMPTGECGCPAATLSSRRCGAIYGSRGIP